MANIESPLDGIKVIEVSTWFAGPTCGMWLGEWGANVIRVEPVEGDPLRGIMASGLLPVSDYNWMWEMANRSKRCIALDLAQKQSQEIMHNLIKDADVFLANLRPSTLERAGLGYKTLSKLNPRLVYANITGYGAKGPGAEWPAFDETAFWARSGIMSTMGEEGTPAVPLRGAMGDNTTGIFMLGGIALALYAREKTGKGQRVDNSLMGNGMWVAGVDIMGALVYDFWIGRFSRKTMGNPLYNTYQAQDAKWFQLQMLQTDRYWPGMCKALSRPDLENDPKFNSHGNRVKSNAELIALLDQEFARKDRDEWGKLFDANDLIWAPALTPVEVIRDACALENGYILEYDHPTHGKLKGVRCPIQLSDTPSRTPYPAPEFGQHTEEVLLEIGYTWEDIAKFKDGKVIL
ncbi:MAG: CoA transferase [Chloroflexi bacterium]|nr:CoA transferase [Chloroflexota bacterium]MBM3182846.1 CoA transferase [Chloroflexota bacterium]MBM4454115.1 CoA transferase [Chloroflexota bacterium]